MKFLRDIFSIFIYICGRWIRAWIVFEQGRPKWVKECCWVKEYVNTVYRS